MFSQNKAKKITKPGRYHAGDNLYLRVKENGKKSWVFRFQLNKRETCMGLGRLEYVTYLEAREAAIEAHKNLMKGINPIGVKNDLRAANIKATASLKTFREAAHAFIDARLVKKWTPEHAESVRAKLQLHAMPKLESLPVKSIDKAIVIDVLEPIWNTTYSTAKHVRGLIESILEFAKTSGWRSGDNPAKYKDNLEHVLPNLDDQAGHRKAVPIDSMYEFMQQLSQVKGTAARAVEFAILTAVRTDEAREATWDEVDFKAKRWDIPAKRMKTKQPHSVPLSPRTLALLDALSREEGNPYLFISDKAGKPVSSLLKTVKRIMPEIEKTTHGFRNVFADWGHERTTFPKAVIDKALAHKIKDKVDAAYFRGDLFEKRIPLMAAWATFCYCAPSTGKVVPIRAA
jgi:integrase